MSVLTVAEDQGGFNDGVLLRLDPRLKLVLIFLLVVIIFSVANFHVLCSAGLFLGALFFLVCWNL